MRIVFLLVLIASGMQTAYANQVRNNSEEERILETRKGEISLEIARDFYEVRLAELNYTRIAYNCDGGTKGVSLWKHKTDEKFVFMYRGSDRAFAYNITKISPVDEYPNTFNLKLYNKNDRVMGEVRIWVPVREVPEGKTIRSLMEEDNFTIPSDLTWHVGYGTFTGRSTVCYSARYYNDPF